MPFRRFRFVFMLMEFPVSSGQTSHGMSGTNTTFHHRCPLSLCLWPLLLSSGDKNIGSGKPVPVVFTFHYWSEYILKLLSLPERNWVGTWMLKRWDDFKDFSHGPHHFQQVAFVAITITSQADACIKLLVGNFSLNFFMFISWCNFIIRTVYYFDYILNVDHIYKKSTKLQSVIHKNLTVVMSASLGCFAISLIIYSHDWWGKLWNII